MNAFCRAPFCQTPAHDHGYFCPRHWRLVPYGRQKAVLAARDALKAARDPIVKAYRLEPALKAAVEEAAAGLTPAQVHNRGEAA